MSAQVNTKGSSGNAHGGFSQEASEDEEAEESSSLTVEPREKNLEDTLADFREKWHKEIKESPKHTQNPKLAPLPNDDSRTNEDEEKIAKTLFLKGAEMERAGKLYEAIQFYRRAVQIVPDIEFRLHDSKPKNREQVKDVIKDVSIEKEVSQLEIREESSDEEDEKDGDLLLRIQSKFSNGEIFCKPLYEQKTMHISSLPVEIILYVFRWIVSSELDLRSLELCSRVCRGFYLCARDSEIWRLACIRTWGVNCGNLPPIYTSWRHMFVERARLHFNGCYISKTTYIRQGENSFQDQFYRPWHFVAYYRYLRFFPEGLVLMLTTAEEPTNCVGQLKSRNIRSPSVLTGHYRLKDNRVTLFVQRPDLNRNNQTYKRGRKRENTWHDSSDQTFHMELEIRSSNKKRHVQLVWVRYSVVTKNKELETSCSFDLVTNRFPPLWFSRVKSYTAESEGPLQ